MAAGIGCLQHKVLGYLFGSHYFERDPAALCVKFTGRAFGQGKLCINRLALIRGQPTSPVQCAACLLTTGQRALYGTLWLDPLLPETNHVVDPNCVLGLHVIGPAAVEIAVLLDHDERMTSPIFAT